MRGVSLVCFEDYWAWWHDCLDDVFSRWSGETQHRTQHRLLCSSTVSVFQWYRL